MRHAWLTTPTPDYSLGNRGWKGPLGPIETCPFFCHQRRLLQLVRQHLQRQYYTYIPHNHRDHNSVIHSIFMQISKWIFWIWSIFYAAFWVCTWLLIPCRRHVHIPNLNTIETIDRVSALDSILQQDIFTSYVYTRYTGFDNYIIYNNIHKCCFTTSLSNR